LKGPSAMHSGSDLDWLLVLALVLHPASPLRPGQYRSNGIGRLVTHEVEAQK
jgi:hypothetical protein